MLLSVIAQPFIAQPFERVIRIGNGCGDRLILAFIFKPLRGGGLEKSRRALPCVADQHFSLNELSGCRIARFIPAVTAGRNKIELDRKLDLVSPWSFAVVMLDRVCPTDTGHDQASLP
jgi:hypothetical protein